MAGAPKRRARREAEATSASESGRRRIVAAPRPRLPADVWAGMSDAERISHLFGLSLTDALELMEAPWSAVDFHEKVLRVRIFEILIKFAQRIEAARRVDKAGVAALASLAEALAKRGTER